MKKSAKRHGGARKGAGRRPSGRVPITVRIDAVVAEWLRGHTARRGELIERLLMQEMMRALEDDVHTK